MISSTLLLSMCGVATGGALLADRLARARRARVLRNLAAEWRMNYSPVDRFRLTPRLIKHFPIPGAARMEVIDLIYGADGDVYRYIFTAAYTAGVMSGKRRVLRAATTSEPRDRQSDASLPIITLADRHRPLIQQYRDLGPKGHSPGAT